jgi:hypothetical protein
VKIRHSLAAGFFWRRHHRYVNGSWVGHCETHTLPDVRPGLLIEPHGLQCEEEVKALLRQAQYDFFDLEGLELKPERILPQHFLARPAKARL